MKNLDQDEESQREDVHMNNLKEFGELCDSGCEHNIHHQGAINSTRFSSVERATERNS